MPADAVDDVSERARQSASDDVRLKHADRASCVGEALDRQLTDYRQRPIGLRPGGAELCLGVGELHNDHRQRLRKAVMNFASKAGALGDDRGVTLTLEPPRAVALRLRLLLLG